MDFSSSNQALWSVSLQLGILSSVILLANILRIKVKFLKKSLMPTSVLAGFILLIVRLTGIIKIDTDLMEVLMYHGIAIGFIALSLQIPKKIKSNNKKDFIGLKSGALIISTYLLQGIIGLGVSAGLSYTIKPGLFKAAGILLPMGYGQGSGQANNVGLTYEALGFVGGQSFGLSIAAMGYLVACVVGIIYFNILKRNGKLFREEKNMNSDKITIEDFESKNEPAVSESVDRFSLQFALVFLVYLFTYLVTKGILKLIMVVAPGLEATLSPLLWGFNFIIGSLLAQVVRNSFKYLKKFKLMNHQYVNNYLLGRISGFAFDVMIVAGIATINMEDLSGLWLPFWLMAILGAILTLWYLQWLCKKLYPDYYYEGMLSMYGMLTGNISSGMMLLREIDPNFETPASNNLLTGSSFAIALGAPILILIALAPQSDLMLLITFVLLIVYMIPLLLIIKGKRNKD